MPDNELGTGLGSRQRLAWCCGYTPEEIIEAAGFWPYRLSGAPYPWSRAGAFLPVDFCSYGVALVEQALASEGLDLAGAVIANSCHAMVHLYNIWQRRRPPAFFFLLEVPRQAGTAAVNYYAANLRQLWEVLKRRLDVRRGEDDLWEAIGLYEETRSLMARVYALGRYDLPPLTGQQVAEVMSLASRSCKGPFNVWLSDRLKFWEEAARRGLVITGAPLPGTVSSPARKPCGPRLLLTGGVVPPELVAFLEEQGAMVVADDLCAGGRYLAAAWCEDEAIASSSRQVDADPFTYLARLYLNRLPCPRLRESERRWEQLVKLVHDYRVDGVIYYSLKFCDYYHYAFPRLRQSQQRSGVPVLRLEGEYTPRGSGQMRTRVQAFLESLENRSGG